MRKTRQFGRLLVALGIMIFLPILPAQAADDVASTTVANSVEKATPVETSQIKTYGTAKDWGLTEEEWTKYQQLMQGPDGLWYSQLTPPAILGMRADNPSDQQHFAEIVARQEHEKVARELAFNKALFVALRRLYPDEPMIKSFDETPFNPAKDRTNHAPKTAVIQPHDHIALFEDPKSSVDVAVLPKLLGITRKNPTVILDIFLMGHVEDEEIQAWAKLHQVPLDMVTSGRITLNRDEGKLQKTTGNTMTPSVLLVRGSESRLVAVWDLG